MTVHYRSHGRRSICGRENLPKDRLSNEIGETGCSFCRRRIEIAGFRALGYSPAKAAQMVAANRREARERRRRLELRGNPA